MLVVIVITGKLSVSRGCGGGVVICAFAYQDSGLGSIPDSDCVTFSALIVAGII